MREEEGERERGWERGGWRQGRVICNPHLPGDKSCTHDIVFPTDVSQQTRNNHCPWKTGLSGLIVIYRYIVRVSDCMSTYKSP